MKITNSALAAQKLLNSLGYSEPADLSIEEIAFACGFMVQYKLMEGCEGRILMSDKEVLISANSLINYQPKVNYILSHEIGHGILHKGIVPNFSDDQKTLSEWYANGIHETEANQFAVELLMPTDLFSRKVKNKKLSLPLIEEVAAYFCASKTATFLRYKDLGSFPVMIIFIEDGIIRWKSCSDDFPYKWIVYGSKLPALTVAGDYYYHQIKEDKPAKVDAIEWFPDDKFLINGDKQIKLWEQCFPTTANSILTCLWTA